MTYRPRLKPYRHQRQANKKMSGAEAFALFMAMRTGKTKVTLDDWGVMEDAGEVKDLLVIAPAGVYKTWAGAITDHVSEDLLERSLVHTWTAGANKTRQNELEDFLATKDARRPRALMVNIEALSSVERARDLCQAFLDQRPCVLVVDESTTIKNVDAKRTKYVSEGLGKRAKYKRILSGLPTPRSPMDLFSQFWFLDPDILGFASYYSFRSRYAITKAMPYGPGGAHVIQEVGYQNEDELREIIAPYSFRKRLEDCYDVPKSLYISREVDLTDEQRRVYQKLKTEALAQLDDMAWVSGTIAVTKLLRMHQVLCGHVRGDEDGQIHLLKEKRVDELLQVLEEYDGKAIIWASYDPDVRKIVERLRKRFDHYNAKGRKVNTVAAFWGGNTKEREEEDRRFREDDDCRYMVATQGAGGRGRMWAVANLVVYYSSTNNLEHRDQSEERPKAVGKVTPITYVDLIVPNTVDGKILRALREKINMAAAITGDNYREWIV